MGSLGDCVKEYVIQLSKGQIQTAYRGIMTFMSDLRSRLEHKYSDFTASAVYLGYMDMTYFAFTPSSLRDRRLKTAIVYLHEECRFESWLAGNTRQIQAEYVEMLSHKDLGRYVLSQIQPGVDSIIASSIVEQPDFDDPDELKKHIEVKTMAFVEEMVRILDSSPARS
ncbi:MAG: hypothetical protein AB9886_02960 [Candidatus Cryosericum sp.]